MRFEMKMSHLIRIFILLLLLVVAGIVIYLNVFSLKRINENEKEKEQLNLENIVNMWDNTIENNTIYIDNFLANNRNVTRLNVASRHEDQVYALQDIRTDMEEYAMLNYGMEELFFYSSYIGEDGYLAAYNHQAMLSSKTQKEQIKEVIELTEENHNNGVWAIEKIDGMNYLLYVKEYNGDYMGCWASLDYLIENVTDNITEDSNEYRFFITSVFGGVLSNEYLGNSNIDPDNEVYKDPETGTKYMQIKTGSGMLPIYFVEHVELNTVQKSIIHIRNIMILLCAILIASILIWSAILERVFYRPIRNIMVNMIQISNGDFDTRIEETSKLKEIALLYRSFNDMTDEIKNLKIEIYEKELMEQRTKLEYFQLQIHPHFLVNGLNSISAMLDMKREAAAKEMCRYLSEYYRYQYQFHSEMVPIQAELKHVMTYIDIQKMRHPDKVQFVCDVDETCHLTLIPPLLMLTFVGNSFKYGMNLKTYKNVIYLDVHRRGDNVLIRIRDEGPGFAGEILEKIEGSQPIVQKDRVCIGIQNTVARLRLFYGENAVYRFYNEGGAVVEIEIIPL